MVRQTPAWRIWVGSEKMLLACELSCLLIVDVQEKLTPVMTDPRRVIHQGALLIRAAARLGVPVLATEQYPKGLGPTMIDLRQLLPAQDILAKTHFSATADPAVLARLHLIGRQQIVLMGIEAHICVLQTALDLKSKGFKPFVVADACASRRLESEVMAWARLRQEGVPLLSLEMVIFEWLQASTNEAFRELSALIR
jgi:nicotinamidase-related amidase